MATKLDLPDVSVTAQQAADRLGVSLPFLTHLLESKAIPFHYDGPERRIDLSALRDYQAEQGRRNVILDELTREAQELNMGY